MPDQISKEISNARLNRLLAVVSETAKIRGERIVGTIRKVLVEEKNIKNPEYVTGRLSGHSVVHFKGSEDLVGTFVNVRLNESKRFYFIGERAEEPAMI